MTAPYFKVGLVLIGYDAFEAHRVTVAEKKSSIEIVCLVAFTT